MFYFLYESVQKSHISFVHSKNKDIIKDSMLVILMLIW